MSFFIPPPIKKFGHPWISILLSINTSGYAPRGLYGGGIIFVGGLSLERVVVPSTKIVINLPGT
jgi:hypothetical protein